MSEMYRTIAFCRRRIGKMHKRSVEVMRVYLNSPTSKERPFFEARIDKDLAKRAVERFKARCDDKGEFLILYGDDVDEKVRKMVVYSGVRQVVNGPIGTELLEMVDSMGELELLFWYSRFINAYSRGGYRDVCRVAKSFRILYGL